MASKKSKQVWEFGDFQTPQALASQALAVLSRLELKAKSVIEPTCGNGSFLLAAANAFPSARALVGLDVNADYLRELHRQCREEKLATIKTIHADFFTFDWASLLNELEEPIAIIGNPPWVTSADLGMLGSSNLPQKSNFQGRKGIEALTGKSNFDISEWMLLKHVEWLQTKKGVLAMLCKTAVARKVLIHAWKTGQAISEASIHKIDALKHFDASVDACFFVVDCTGRAQSFDCDVYESLGDERPSHIIGYREGALIADVNLYEKRHGVLGRDKYYVWRSGIKHDCSKVMELEKEGVLFRNGAGEMVGLEEEYVYLLYKSSDISNGRLRCRKYVIVTQKTIGKDTAHISADAPKTWAYLVKNAEKLDRRGSTIYKKRPRFSIFGVGDYSFEPWKVAISGFYKNLSFKVLAPTNGRPAMVDDTVYFLACKSKDEGEFLSDILNSEPAHEALNSLIFWSDKRPITVEVLKRLNIRAVAEELSREHEYDLYTGKLAATN